MSIKIMAEIWEAGPEDQTARFVLLALADHANDQGMCWPSMGAIAKKTCMTVRGVQKVIRRLQDEGWLDVVVGGGRHGCNNYTIKTPNTVQGKSAETPNPVHPEHGSPPNQSAKNPEPRSPEPSRTINISSNSARVIRDELTKWASTEAADSFIAYRRKQKGKALSETAARRQAKQLEKIFQAGGDPSDALGMAEERGWQSVQADWYLKAKERENGLGDTKGSSAHPGDKQIAIAARFARSPSEDCF